MNLSLFVCRLLDYSYRDIRWQYDQLTDAEKACCTREEFDALREKVLGTLFNDDTFGGK